MDKNSGSLSGAKKTTATFAVETVIELLEKETAGYQVPVVDLIAVQTHDPFKVLVATILSARTRDEVTAEACRRMFARAENVDQLANLTVSELEKLIYPVGFFRNKAKYLSQLPEALDRQFGGIIPDSIEGLTKLPGVGRKTANLVRSVAFDKPAICVDTHVHRIMNIWGFVATETPLQTEMELRKKLPVEYWKKINSILVAFGQGTCKPLRPHCDRCVVNSYCPQLGVTPGKVPGRVEAKGSKLFVSWNVNGLRAALNKDFLGVFHSFNADIFAVQEIKALPEQLPSEVLEIPGYHAYWNPAEKKGYSGTAVFTKHKPLEVIYGIGVDDIDGEGRVLTLEFEDFFFINSYFPNAQHGLKRLGFKTEFNNRLRGFMEELRQVKSVVLCGDLNVAHKPIDLANPKANEKNPGYSEEERAWMDSLIESGYIDSFRKYNLESGQYTWWSYRFNSRAKNIGWRIDYFLVDGDSRDRLYDAAVHMDVMGSDHCPVSIEYR